MSGDNIQDLALKYSLQNAVKYEGTASAGSVIGQIIREHPEHKGRMKELQSAANEAVEKVNKLPLDEQRAQLETLAPQLLEKKEHKEHDLFGFLKITPSSTVATGWPPEPGKYLHIGHAKAALANYELARRNKGRFVLRYDDTNPSKPKAEFYGLILKDLNWLGIEPDKVDVGSERIYELYPIAEQLIAAGQCYVCDCDAEKTNALRYAGEACQHRTQEIAETQERWKNLQEGEVLRLRIDPAHKNTTMRDPTLFRVIHEPHPRVGTTYHIWPTYDFETCLLDSLEKLTHRLRTKEFELRSELHNYIQRLAGFPETTYYEFGRFAMEGVDTQGRVVREKIASGAYSGWDDPRLATLVALRRRGFTPEAIKSFVLSTGLTKNDSTMTWDDLYIHNRRILNEKAKRLFFVDYPVLINIRGASAKFVEMSYFPHAKESKERVFNTDSEFYISKEDEQSLRVGDLYRLMDCINFIRDGDDYAYVDDSLATYRARGKRILHYLPREHEAVAVEVLLPDGSTRKGLGESRITALTVGDHVQFERFGFCRLDSVEDGVYKFWFTHK
jgi:glutamyl-tRNA synthetase